MEEQIGTIIAKNLIELRKNRNLKQTDLSEALGYSDKTISRWENGTSVPDIETLVNIAKFYGIGIEDLINENAVTKSSEDEENKFRQKFARDMLMLALAICTLWLVLVLFYLGFYMIQQSYIWQIFVWGVPITGFLAYRTSKRYYTKLWLSLSLFIFITISIVVAIYLQIIEYNFWQLFLILIPLEGMGIVNILYRHKIKLPLKPKKEKNKK